MKFKKNILFLLIIVSGQLFAQSQFQEFIQHLYQLNTVEAKEAAIDSFMVYARAQSIPFVENDKANFIYYGTANSVVIAGDFNGWNPSDSKMTQMSGTNFFFRTETFELNARLDYKFVVNNVNWILDPENPNRISGGFGPNSELAMPEYVQPWEIKYNQSIKHGTRESFNIASSIVGRNFNVSVYLPPSYNSETAHNYPSVYFQDGSEYITLGSAINVIDNLIDSNKIAEVIGVFVTPNDRNEEYAFAKRNEYAQFFATELVPYIDSVYRTSRNAADRLVIGDSYGGNISGLISYTYANVFGNCGLHSPAFQPNDYEVYKMIVNGEKKNIKFAGSWGTYEGLKENVRSFRDIIITKGYSFDWLERPEGHSWGLWRANTDLILKSIFPYGFTSVKAGLNIPKQFELFQNYPNPFNPTTVIKFSLNQEQSVKLKIMDALGQEVKTLLNEIKPAGSHQVIFNGNGLSSGVYLYSITANGITESKKMQLLK